MNAQEKSARQAALAKVKAAFNFTAEKMNEGGDALRPYSIAYQQTVSGFNEVVEALTSVRQTIVDAIAKTDAIVVGASDIGSGAALNASPTVLMKLTYTPPDGGPALEYTIQGTTDLTTAELEARGIFKEPDHGGHT